MTDLPESRADAQLAGSPHYHTGRPCKHGHIANRRADTGQCMECCRLRAKGRVRQPREPLPAALQDDGFGDAMARNRAAVRALEHLGFTMAGRTVRDGEAATGRTYAELVELGQSLKA